MAVAMAAYTLQGAVVGASGSVLRCRSLPSSRRLDQQNDDGRVLPMSSTPLSTLYDNDGGDDDDDDGGDDDDDNNNNEDDDEDDNEESDNDDNAPTMT